MPAQATNAHDVDRPISCISKNAKRDKLLDRLRYVHGEEGRPDIARELSASRQQRSHEVNRALNF